MLAMDWRRAVDFAAVATFLYIVLRLARDARALRTALMVIVLYIASSIARSFDLLITTMVLQASALIGIGVLVLAFHSELRYAIIRFNDLFLWPKKSTLAGSANRELVFAVFSMAEARVGALIVILGRDAIADITTRGVPIGAEVSGELLRTIFQKDSPLHDGAVIIESGRLSRANVVLPLSSKDDLPGMYGTRHRAGLGLSENSDALAIVVSEQRGEVSVMRGGQITTLRDADHMFRLLAVFDNRPLPSARRVFTRVLTADIKVKLVSSVLAAAICLVSVFTSTSIVRVVRVPIEFTEVSDGAELLDQSSRNITLQFRGQQSSIDSLPFSKLVAHFSLKNAADGVHHFRVTSSNIDLPGDVVLDNATPADVSIRVVRRHDKAAQQHHTGS